ncbi:hypothetical protein NVP1170O_178 [Vibrio phage 1.170.O._10N.261.52.C3]|nr:hypothetical protein NVP1170O_178 [Vibrio phage 1.170.O._10N.261.52.C3]
MRLNQDKVEEFLCELCEDIRNNDYKNSTIISDVDGVRLNASGSGEHIGGLEGFYHDHYTGTIYLDNECYYFTIDDVFCDGTEFDLERDEDGDLRDGDEGYVGNKSPYTSVIKANIRMNPVLESDADLRKRCLEKVRPESIRDENVAPKYSFASGEKLDALANLIGLERKGSTKETQTKFFDEKGETTMTKLTTVTVRIFDEDESLGSPSTNNLVAMFKDIVVREGEGADKILLKVAMDGSLKEAIDKHNEARVKLPNKKILERTGKKVMLEEVTIDDLRVTVE